MKKYIILLLALVLCLSLCACEADSKSETTEAIVTTTKESAVQKYPVLKEIFGTWEGSSGEGRTSPFLSFTINEDGTCIVDGVKGTWEVDEGLSSFMDELWICFYCEGLPECGIYYPQFDGKYEMYSFAGMTGTPPMGYFEKVE